jgi:hypothetical protein
MTDDGLANLILARAGVFIEEGYRGQHQSRGAEAALDCAFFHERFLNRMKAASTSAESLNCEDLLALSFNGKIEARVDGFTVQEDGASAALAFLAGALGSGQTEILAKNVQQSAPRWNGKIVRLAIDPQGNR